MRHETFSTNTYIMRIEGTYAKEMTQIRLEIPVRSMLYSDGLFW